MRNVLFIGGMDPLNGSGLGLDLRVANTFGIHPFTITTNVTSQNNNNYFGHQEINPEWIASQWEAMNVEENCHAIKIGMIGSVKIAKILYPFIERSNVPIVMDPLWLSSSGGLLVDDFQVLSRYFDKVTLLTPNWVEFQKIENYENYSCSFLIKGGHRDTGICQDVFIDKSTDNIYQYFSPRWSGDFRGTGCFLASSITCLLAKGNSLLRSVCLSRALLKKSALCSTQETSFLKISYGDHSPKIPTYFS